MINKSDIEEIVFNRLVPLIPNWTKKTKKIKEALSDIADKILAKNWIDIEDDIKPEHEENVLGFAGYWWVFQYHAEHNHYLEYSERRKRWEFTTNSHNVTKWQPLPS